MAGLYGQATVRAVGFSPRAQPGVAVSGPQAEACGSDRITRITQRWELTRTIRAGGTRLRVAEPGQGGLTQTKDVALKGAEIGEVLVVGKLLEDLGIGEARTGQDDGNPIVIGHLRQGLKLLVHEVFLV